MNAGGTVETHGIRVTMVPGRALERRPDGRRRRALLRRADRVRARARERLPGLRRRRHDGVRRHGADPRAVRARPRHPADRRPLHDGPGGGGGGGRPPRRARRAARPLGHVPDPDRHAGRPRRPSWTPAASTPGPTTGSPGTPSTRPATPAPQPEVPGRRDEADDQPGQVVDDVAALASRPSGVATSWMARSSAGRSQGPPDCLLLTVGDRRSGEREELVALRRPQATVVGSSAERRRRAEPCGARPSDGRPSGSSAGASENPFAGSGDPSAGAALIAAGSRTAPGRGRARWRRWPTPASGTRPRGRRRAAPARSPGAPWRSPSAPRARRRRTAPRGASRPAAGRRSRSAAMSGSRPARRIRSWARSIDATGSPMSSTNRSPLRPSAAASRISRAASGMVMKKRVMSGCVIVSGPPFSSCSWKIGTTLPVEPSTLPNRTETYGRPVRLRGVGDEHLGDPLARAHHARRADGLVGGDEHEALDARRLGGIQHDHRAADVDVHGVGRMLLHHRHVLVGGGVEDHARRLVGDQAAHRLPAGDVGEVHAQLAAALPAQPARLELALDEVERALGAVDQHQPARARGRIPGAQARTRSSRRRR